jgi:hypothetical protein
MSVMPQRDMRILHFPSRGGQSSQMTEAGTAPSGLDIRFISREKVLQHNRPESITRSLMSASERLLMSRPFSSKRTSRVTSAASSAAKKAQGMVCSRLDSQYF